jgi:hypothetical protein
VAGTPTAGLCCVPMNLDRPFTFVLGLVLCGVLSGGCVVKDELKEGLREMRSEVPLLTLTRNADGSGLVDFTFKYGIAVVDEGGIAEIPWNLRLVDRNQVVYAELFQVMRKAEPDERRALVTGERRRVLEVVPGLLSPGGTYALWITATYEGEVLHESLWPVSARAPGEIPATPEPVEASSGQ